MGGTRAGNLYQLRSHSFITLNAEVDPLADGWRDPVAGDAHVAADVTSAHAVEHQGGGAEAGG